MPLAPLVRARAFLSAGRTAHDLSPEDYRQMRVTGTVEYLAGAATLAIVTVLPDPDASDHVPYLVLALIGVLLSGLRFLAPQRPGAVRASILIGFIYIAAIIAVARPVGPTPFFFLWPMLTAAYFLGRRELALFAGAYSLSLGAGLYANGAVGATSVMFMPTFLAIVIVSGLVLALRERVDGLMGDLAYTASTDMLTGLPNRRSFEDACHRELERARRTGAPVSLAIFDLDHFKAINDRLGHAEGDRALKRFAELLQDGCRCVDYPARIGGEEFALLLPDADAAGARLFAERLLDRVIDVTRTDIAPISVSIGISQMNDPRDTQDVLLLAADRALYEAKNTGRAKVVVALPVPGSRAEHTGQQLELTP